MVANNSELEKRLWGAADVGQRMEEIHETLELLNAEAHELEERIAYNMRKLLNGN